MNLHKIDLNLLVLFDALYRHRSVSLAATEICISQSAFSHGLTRLRNRLNDQLFVRINNVMQPTERAVEIATVLQSALPLIEQSLQATKVFDPQESELTFRLTATDYTEYCLLPKLMAHLNQVAPKIKIKVLPAATIAPSEQLANKDVDFSMGFTHQNFNSSIIEHYNWLSDSYCTIARKNHPQLGNKLTIEDFIALPHILIAPWGESQGVVDQALNMIKKKRSIALQLPSLLVAPHVIKETNYLLTLPRLIAEQFSQQHPCQIYQTPVDIPNYQLNIYWHKINSDKVAFKWFIEQIKTLTLR